MAVSRTRSDFTAPAPSAGGSARAVHGAARLGRRTKELVKKLGSNDVAIIDHRDIDRISAEELIETGVPAVVNVAPSSSGRYPNAGPLLLTRAGVLLVDVPGAPLFDRFKNGDPIRLEGGAVYAGAELVAEGRVLDPEEIALGMEELRREIGGALERFAENTMAHVVQEREVLAGRIDLPDLETSFRDRHALVVVRGPGHKRDLRALRPYIREVRPVLVGVDGGADALAEAGQSADLIVGDMDSARDETLRSGAELVVHAYADGHAPGRERLEQLGLPYQLVPAPGTSQDLALLTAYEKGAELIVVVGAPFNLVEFLEREREGMSSTFLTRLRIGEILVDAKGVSRLYRPAAGRGHLVLLLAAALITLVVVIISSPPLKRLADLLWLKLKILMGIS